MHVSDKMDEDYQKIAHQVSQLRQATKAAAGQQAKQPAPQNECIFCKIAKKEMPAKVIEENSHFIAFLDIQPKAVGHAIVVSKRHFASMDEMDHVESSTLLDMVGSVSRRMKSNLKATGYSVVSANGISSGQIVPHFAVHIIPTYTHAVDIPLLNVIQHQKVPDFVMSDVERLLKRLDR